MDKSSRTVVAAVRNYSYDRTSVRHAFQNLLDKMEPSLPSVIKSGDRVLVKPFLHYGPHSNFSSRAVSHPEVVAAVIEALKDCGALVLLGDEGSKKLRNESVPLEKQWIHDLAKTSGATLVSFAKTGARHIRSGQHFPRHYLITRAVLDVDHVVSCANFQPHYILGMSGAVKNMFNAVVGTRQAHLHELFPNPKDLARIIVDVCAVTRPSISFLDLTSVRDPISKGSLQPVGLLLAGVDPVALDAVAVRAVGWEGNTIPTITLGEKHGLGCADLKRIKLSGLDWTELQTIRLAYVPTLVAQPDGLYDRITRIVNKTVMRPRPMITKESCTRCSDCQQICPVQAIYQTLDGAFSIKKLDCADCHVCINACEHDAIELQHVGIGKVVRRLMNRPKAPR